MSHKRGIARVAVLLAVILSIVGPGVTAWTPATKITVKAIAGGAPAAAPFFAEALELAAVLGLLDMTNVVGSPASDRDEPGPPAGVLVATGILGLVMVVAVVYTWRTVNRTGSRVVAGSRILSAITALPALFVTGDVQRARSIPTATAASRNFVPSSADHL